MSYFKQKDFASYLKVAKKKNNYEGYITTIYQKILKPSNIQILFDDLELCLAKYPAKAIEGLEKIQDFINITYSLSKQSPIGLKAKLYIVLHNMSPRSFRDYAVGLNEYINFIKANIATFTKPKGYHRYLVTPWNEAIKKLDVLFVDNISVNGNDSLISRFSSPNDFVKYVLQNSFFFSKTMAQNRFADIANSIAHHIPIPVRDSNRIIRKLGRDWCNCSDECSLGHSIQFEVTIDSDGNKNVRDLIELETGYTTSSGPNCIFTNHIISHIWGDAFDPRNFTNYWNLAIVPAWANYILDKISSQDTLALKLINTFKAICVEQYGMGSKSYNWPVIYKHCPTYDMSYVVHGNYDIFVINPKGNKPYGRIIQKTIKI